MCDNGCSNQCNSCPFFINSCEFCDLMKQYVDSYEDIIKELKQYYEIETCRIYK